MGCDGVDGSKNEVSNVYYSEEVGSFIVSVTVDPFFVTKISAAVEADDSWHVLALNIASASAMAATSYT